MTRLFRTGAALCVLAGTAAGLTAYGARRWAAATRTLIAHMEAERLAPNTARYDARELDGLPAPVQRYFRAVLQDGQPAIAAATIELVGKLNLSATGARWKPFTSQQRVVTRRPGFVWDAKVSVLPGVAVRVVDGYVAGEGRLRVALGGWLTMAEVHGAGEIARGELMRFFAEAAWYPTALLPSQGVRWAPIDDRSAHATLVDGPLALTLLFTFDDDGLIASARAEARGAMVGDRVVMTPWEGCWSNYRTIDGMRVPTTGEAAWLRPEGRAPYFVGTVTSLVHEHPP